MDKSIAQERLLLTLGLPPPLTLGLGQIPVAVFGFLPDCQFLFFPLEARMEDVLVAVQAVWRRQPARNLPSNPATQSLTVIAVR